MCRKVFLLISLLLVLSAASRAGAICFDANLLASYEPPEVNDLNTTPGPEDATLTATWVRGGENNVPPATEGEYVLKLDWTNEANPNKIQVRHDWKYTRFDLADANFIHADVYIAAESAMPDAGGMGIWDSGWSFPWIGADCEPPRVNEWYSIPYGVAALSEPNLDHIEALVFDKLAGTSGTIYVDNLRIGAEEPDCHCRRKIIFSGYTWSVLQSDYKIGAGPNCFTDDPNDVWLDPNGHLHLNVLYKDASVVEEPNWYCSEVIANENLGYGTYVFTVRDEVNSLDPNIVLGLFIYDVPTQQSEHREIDVELTRWGDPDDHNNAQFVVQPWNHTGNVHRFKIDYMADTETTTHEIGLRADQIDFRSYYGDCPLTDLNDLIESWSYTGPDIPAPGCENPRINFYLMEGEPPTNEQDAEVVIKSFQYFGNIAAEIDIDPDTVNLASKGRWITCYISLGEGHNVADIDSCCVLLEERIKAERITLDEAEQVAIAKFSRAQVQDMLGELDVPGHVEVTVRGQLTDGTRFKGSDTIRVIDKGKKK